MKQGQPLHLYGLIEEPRPYGKEKHDERARQKQQDSIRTTHSNIWRHERMDYSLQELSKLVEDPAVHGLSISRQLQPLGGRGDAVSPPTFAQAKGEEKGPRYVWSERRIGDEAVKTCLLDSSASQANRIEESLLDLVRSKTLTLALHRMDVPNIGVLTDLEWPHRIYDAAVGPAKLLDGTPWRNSDLAKQVRNASRKDASALLQHAPLVLILGGWDSHSGTAANAWQGRHEKAVWSKIVAIDAFKMNRPGGRLDPMGLPSSEKVDLGEGSKKLVDQVPVQHARHGESTTLPIRRRTR